MGYLGQNSTFTGTQNSKRINLTATALQKDFQPSGGYNINMIDVYRNGIRLVQSKDYTATDGTTVSLVQAAAADDILEFEIFENFVVADALSGDGDSVINGSLNVTGTLTAGVLDASPTYTPKAGFSTEAVRAGMSTNATRSGITTHVDGYLARGVTGTNLNCSGVITATSFSGSGANLTGIAATDNVSTSSLVVSGISTLGNVTAGVATANQYSGSVTGTSGTFTRDLTGANVTVSAASTHGDNIKANFGAANDMQIYHDGTADSFIKADSTHLKIRSNTFSVISAADDIMIGAAGGAGVTCYHNNVKVFETVATGVTAASALVGIGVTITANDHLQVGTGITMGGASGAGNLSVCGVVTGGSAKFGAGVTMTTNDLLQVGSGITMGGAAGAGNMSMCGILTAGTVKNGAGVEMGQNAIGARTVQSGGSPSGGDNGDIVYIY